MKTKTFNTSDFSGDPMVYNLKNFWFWINTEHSQDYDYKISDNKVIIKDYDYYVVLTNRAFHYNVVR